LFINKFSNLSFYYISKREWQPMVRAVAGHSALAAWEIINEPEGLTVPYQSNSNACFDTNLMGSLGGYGWSGYGIPWERYTSIY